MAGRAGFVGAAAGVRHRATFVVSAEQKVTGIKDTNGLVGDFACIVDVVQSLL